VHSLPLISPLDQEVRGLNSLVVHLNLWGVYRVWVRVGVKVRVRIRVRVREPMFLNSLRLEGLLVRVRVRVRVCTQRTTPFLQHRRFEGKCLHTAVETSLTSLIHSARPAVRAAPASDRRGV